MSEQPNLEENKFRNEEVQVYYEAMKEWALEDLMNVTRNDTNQDKIDAAWIIITEREQEEAA